jgi:hypothetical protein
MRSSRIAIVLAVAGFAGSALISSAAVVFTEADLNSAALVDPPNSATNYALVTAGDLLIGRPSSNTAGNFALEGTGGLPRLNDGAVPATLNRTQAANPTGFNFTDFATAGNTGGTTVTYTLAAPSTITSIQTLGGWQDSGRDQQSYTVSYSTDGTTFTPLSTINFNPTNVPANRPDATSVTLTSPGDPLTNVVAVKFDFNGTENGYSGYDELAVYGTTPEPASLGLVAVAGLGLLARRRRA